MSVGFNNKEIGSDLSKSSFSMVLVVTARLWWTGAINVRYGNER